MYTTRTRMLGLLSVLWVLSACGRDADARQNAPSSPSAPAADGGKDPDAGRDAGLPLGNDNPGQGQPITPPPGASMGGAAGAKAMGECAAVTHSSGISRVPADIIFAIDTSGSMSEEIGFVQDNMNAFSQRIIDSGIDVHVILVAASPKPEPGFLGFPETSLGVCIAAPLGSGDCPLDSSPPLYTHVEREIGSNDVLSRLIETYPEYREHLRESSLKTFVTVTDDNANTTADDFIAAVQSLEPHNPAFWSNYHYSSICSFSRCSDGAQGSVHRELVAKTHGVEGDLCQQNFSPVFDALAQQVQDGSKLTCDWLIPAPPTGEKLDVAKTNVQLTLDGERVPIGKIEQAADCRDREGWHYNDVDAPTHVVACPASCSRVQSAAAASVDISFGCETRRAPD